MGNEISQANSKLGTTSLAVTTPNIELPQFQKFLQLFKKIIEDKQQNNNFITREDFLAILKQIDKLTPSDSELFIQLFTLFDEDGHDLIDYKSYLAGVSICLISSLTLTEKLQFAFQLFDVNNSGYVLRLDCKKVLIAVNNTAAYFGDPVLALSEIETANIEIFKEVPNQTLSGAPIADLITVILAHPMIQKFMTGEGTVRFGSPELNLN